MDNNTFNEVVDRRIGLIKSILTKKGKEYSSDNDRLYNFKRAAEIERCTQKRAWLGKYTKHLVSVLDLVEGRIEPTQALIDEKIGDSINYHILLEAMFKEEALAGCTLKEMDTQCQMSA